MREQKLHIEKGDLITREMLFAYLNNELDASEKLRIENLIAKDEFLSDAVEGLKGADLATVNNQLDKIYRDIDILTGIKKPFTISQSVRMYAAAASLILIVGLTFILIGRLNESQKNAEIAFEPVSEISDTIVSDTTSMESDMGGGMAESEKMNAADTFIIMNNTVDDISPASGEIIALNKQPLEGVVEYKSGNDFLDKTFDEEKISAVDLSLATPAAAEIAVTEDVLSDASISAPFTTSNVASTTESYGYVGDKDIAATKTSDEKYKKVKNRKESKEESVSPSSVERSDAVMDEVYFADDAKTDSAEIYLLPEIMPQFPGGQDSMMNYLRNNLIYPETQADYEGNVYVKFVINEDGSINNAQIVKGLAPAFDMEALRVVNQMPAWIPGKQNNVPVKTYFTLVVKFSGE